jgi:outer membrane protein OmpA-like peptidoglycan-associated protein
MKAINGIRTAKALAATVLLCSLSVFAQESGTNSHVQTNRSGNGPVFRVTVVERTTKAINYRHRSGSTPIDFRGTELMPQAKGEAIVNSKQGRIEIDARMEHLSPATQFGPEYLTYVLWAVTPEGRPKNLGEVLLNGTNSKLDVTTDLQTFGLIVTAEPYFAVTQPSDFVVMENTIRNDTQGTIEPIDTKYELLQKGIYLQNVNSSEVHPFVMNHKTPLEFYEAENAVRIAKWAGSEEYAADTLHKAEEGVQNAQEELNGKVGKKTVSQNSRDAAQNAEDARLIAIQKIQDEAAAREKAAAEQRDAERMNAERAKAQADQAAAEAQAEAQRQAQARQAAEQSAEQAEQDKAQLREQLRQQLNVILETRETARGLIVNMSDVLFDSGQHTLKPGAREKLAKVSGIILAHPGLSLQVEGHTDSVGGDEFNQQLSEKRADSVRDYLVAQGISGDVISAEGVGKADPVAANSTAAGRQQNRRVELIVSGAPIGTAGPSTSGISR